MRTMQVVVALFFLMAAFFACQRSETRSPETEPKAQKTNKDSSVAKAYIRFVYTRRDEFIDFNALDRMYKKDLASYVKNVDARHGTGFDRTIADAIEKGLAGQDIRVNAQRAEKTIQRAFILTFKRSMRDVGKASAQIDNLSMIHEAAPAIRMAAERRSNWAGKGTEYSDTFNTVLKSLSDSARLNDEAGLSKAKASLEALVTKILVLSVFYELEGLEKARGASAEKAAEKRVEAQIYHFNFLEEHGKRNEEGANSVERQLAKPTGQIDVDLVRKILKNDFKGELSDVEPSLLGL